MAPMAEATLTDFLRDPNSIVEKLERQDVVLHRRNAGDLRRSLQSRSEADDEGIRFIAHLLGQAPFRTTWSVPGSCQPPPPPPG